MSYLNYLYFRPRAQRAENLAYSINNNINVPPSDPGPIGCLTNIKQCAQSDVGYLLSSRYMPLLVQYYMANAPLTGQRGSCAEPQPCWLPPPHF